MLKLRNQWSFKYAQCQKCGKTELRHRAKGLCQRCYGRELARQHPEKRILRHKLKNPKELGFLIKCYICGSAKDLLIHHKDLNSKNNGINNFVTLCRRHHTLLHRFLRYKVLFIKFPELTGSLPVGHKII